MLASLVAQMVKSLPAMWEAQVQYLGQEDPWRTKWQPTPVFLLGKSDGQRSLTGLAGYNPWDHKESDTTEQLTLSLSTPNAREGADKLGHSYIAGGTIK